MQLNELPNMNTLLSHPLLEKFSGERAKHAARAYLQDLRESVIRGSIEKLPTADECARVIRNKIDSEDIPGLRGLINATGIILHTNLGRAPLGLEMYAAVSEVFGGYCNLEYDLNTGRRGSRHSHVESIICELTGAEAAMVVNNNAAAAMLMLGAIADGKGVAISRGELVEIGGSFRVPEIIEHSGAKLVEVGSTNRTRLSDYAKAVTDKGAQVLLKVHTSNFKVVGFTDSVSITELAQFGAQHNLPVLYDMGACFLMDPGMLGLHAGNTAHSGIAAGADVICFSGDKLLGSAQAGILAGRGEYISAMKKHPLARALRPDKLTLSVLESCLRLFRYPEEAIRQIPTLSMLAAKPDDLKRRALCLAERLTEICPGWKINVCQASDETGGGSLPNVTLPGWAVSLEPVDMSVAELEGKLRQRRVIVRINNGVVLMSPRTLLSGEDEKIIDAFLCILQNG